MGMKRKTSGAVTTIHYSSPDQLQLSQMDSGNDLNQNYDALSQSLRWILPYLSFPSDIEI